jgi:hypothetical protein
MPNTNEDQIAQIELKGVAENAHERFPIQFAYGQNSGTAYFTGCRLNAKFRRYDVVAFGEIAEQLAGVTEGTVLHVKAEFRANKGKDDKWYDQWNVIEVIDVY